MSVQPRIIEKSKADAGTVRMLADLNRKVNKLMANANSIPAGSISGSGGGGAGQIAAGTINTAEITAGAITATTIAAASITAAQIAAGTITSANIAAGTIVASNIQSGTITSAQIATGTITAGNIASNTITASQIASNTITASQIAASTITTTQIAANTITGSNIAAATITGTNIAASTITAGLLSVSNLAAISANLGTITSGTVTGATIQTATGTGARVVMDITGIKAYNASNVNMVTIDATTGLITATGIINAQTGSAIPTGVLTGVLPGGANRISNSNWQDGAGTFTAIGWTTSNSTVTDGGTTVQPVLGQRAAKLTISANGNATIYPSAPFTDPNKRVVPGLNYTASAYVYPSTAARNVQFIINWYNSAGTYISQNFGPNPLVTAGAWSRQQYTVTAPATAAFGLPVLACNSCIASDAFYLNAFQFEMGDQASAYEPRADEILYNSINANMIVAASITGSNIAATTITAGNIAANTITAAQIAANTITASQIAANTITASQIASATITATQISATAGITAAQLSVTSLSAISANLGSITSGTVTAATVQSSSTVTATGGSILDSAGFRHYISGNSTPVINLSSSGAAFTGAITATQLEIVAGTGSQGIGVVGPPPLAPANAVQWYDPANSSTILSSVGSIIVTYTGIGAPNNAQNTTVSTVYYDSARTRGYNIMQALDAAGTGPASSLEVYGTKISGIPQGVIAAYAGSKSALIMDSTGSSSFVGVPQFTSADTNLFGYTRTMDWGATQITATAGTAFSLSHGLGGQPGVYIASLLGLNGYCYGTSATTTTVSFKSNVALSNTWVLWMAMLG